ncbi:MAG: hypothetical protein C5B51_27745 [Terriglobia bacterium]|nr:MAG: hypothetical protein C5B51_27745 [Terriglobia bacterium]
MANYDTLLSAGVIPPQHTLSNDDIQVINNLTQDEVNALIDLKSALGEDFIRRNTVDAPNCIL